MKRFVSISTLIVVCLSLNLGPSTPSSAQTSDNLSHSGKNIPDKLLYEMYFRRIAFFEDLANRQELPDLSRIRMREVIKEELSINDNQNDILSQISRQALEGVALLDQQAKEIIGREHARYPGGEIKALDQVPKVPIELISLQQARDAIFINAKSQLLNQMGTAVFDEIDLRIKLIILPNVKVINPE